MNAITDPILSALKSAYFTIIKTEDYPRTPQITEQLDNLEREIRTRTSNRPHSNATNAS